MASPISRERPIHFIGIGGIGMSALALILSSRGYQVSGSEPRRSPSVDQLTERGVRVFPEQNATTIEQLIDRHSVSVQVVVSSAIPEHNPELVAA